MKRGMKWEFVFTCRKPSFLPCRTSDGSKLPTWIVPFLKQASTSTSTSTNFLLHHPLTSPTVPFVSAATDGESKVSIDANTTNICADSERAPKKLITMGLKPWERANLKQRIAQGDQKAAGELQKIRKQEAAGSRRRYQRRASEHHQMTKTTTPKTKIKRRPQRRAAAIPTVNSDKGDSDDDDDEIVVAKSGSKKYENGRTKATRSNNTSKNAGKTIPTATATSKRETIDPLDDSAVENVLVAAAINAEGVESEAEIELLLEKVALRREIVEIKEREVDLKLVLLRMRGEG